MSEYKPFPWFNTISQQIRANGPHSLRGEELVFSSDSSFKNGYVVDAMLCTDMQSLDEWRLRNEEIRNHHALGMHGLHYKDLKPTQENWAAIWPTMKSAAMLRGVAVVVRTPPSMIDPNVQIVVDLKKKGLMNHKHDWKAMEYVKMVGLTSLLGAIAGAVCTERSSVLWVSDSDPMFNNSDQLEDIKDAVTHALDVHVSHEMGSVEVRTKRKPQSDQWAFDLVNILDLYAGAVGDVLFESTVSDDGKRTEWTPSLNDRRNMKIANVGEWFIKDIHNPLMRYTFDLGPLLLEGDVVKHTVSCLSGTMRYPSK